MVAVPGRDVYAGLHLALAGVDKGAKYVEGVGNGMCAVRAGPQAEPVVVLGGEDDAAHAGLFGHVDPLAAVQRRGGEHLLGLLPRAPFGSREGVGSKVAEHVDFHALPCQLGIGRHRTIGLWCRSRAGHQDEGCGGDNECVLHGRCCHELHCKDTTNFSIGQIGLKVLRKTPFFVRPMSDSCPTVVRLKSDCGRR